MNLIKIDDVYINPAAVAYLKGYSEAAGTGTAVHFNGITWPLYIKQPLEEVAYRLAENIMREPVTR